MTQFISGFTKSDTFPCLINSLIAVFEGFSIFGRGAAVAFVSTNEAGSDYCCGTTSLETISAEMTVALGIFTVFKKVKVFDPSKSFYDGATFFRRNVLLTREIWKNNNKTRPAFSRTGLGLTEFKFAFLREIKRSRERLRERKREKRNNFKPE